MSSQTQDSLSIAQNRLNDAAGAIWTSAVMLPNIQEAFRDLQVAVFALGLPVLKNVSTVVPVAIGATSLNVTVTIPDLVTPIKVREKNPSDPSNYFTDMQEVNFIPDIVADNVIRYWCWMKNDIYILASTVAKYVEVFYRRGLTVPAAIDANTNLGLTYAETFVGPKAAAIAARVVGNSTLADELEGIAAQRLDMILRGNVKAMQGMSTKRKPFRRSGRRYIV